MNETGYIAREQAKHDKRLKKQLTKIKTTGELPQNQLETLLMGDYVILTGPSEVNCYNHYKLTERGEKELERLSET